VKIRDTILHNLGWVIMIGTLIFGMIFVPYFSAPRNLINILYHSSILGILVLAESLCLLSGNLDLSIESTLAMSVAIPALCMVKWFPSMPPGMGVGLTFLIGLLIGLTNGFFIVKMGINPLLMTLSMLIILRGLMLYLVPMAIAGLPKEYLFIGGAPILDLPLPIVVLIGAYVFFYFVMKYTNFGRGVYATGGNKIAAFTAGINTDGVVISIFALSGLLASVAGWIMVGRIESVSNIMGEGMVFFAFAGAVLGGLSLKGGIGTISGAFSGVLLLGIIDNLLRLGDVSPYLVHALKGFLILIAITVDSFKRSKGIYF